MTVAVDVAAAAAYGMKCYGWEHVRDYKVDVLHKAAAREKTVGCCMAGTRGRAGSGLDCMVAARQGMGNDCCFGKVAVLGIDSGRDCFRKAGSFGR